MVFIDILRNLFSFTLTFTPATHRIDKHGCLYTLFCNLLLIYMNKSHGTLRPVCSRQVVTGNRRPYSHPVWATEPCRCRASADATLASYCIICSPRCRNSAPVSRLQIACVHVAMWLREAADIPATIRRQAFLAHRSSIPPNNSTWTRATPSVLCW